MPGTSSPTGWTTHDQLVGEGGSAGGLLIGAVANEHPDLFGGLVAEVPFVDALTSMLDASLPLTVTEYDEWGDPDDARDLRLHRRLRAVRERRAQDYPPILATTSVNDTRVLYVEPAKWVARLRATATGRRDLLLKTEMSAGHGGVSGRYQAWHDRAFTQAWILDRMGLAERRSRAVRATAPSREGRDSRSPARTEKSLRVRADATPRPPLTRLDG